MSENLNRDFSKYETMETEELEEILRLDAEAPLGAESDTELILHILEVLASRKNIENITRNRAQKAWESFQQNYMPEEPRKPAEKNAGNWLRSLTAAAAVVALLVIVPVSTSALTLGEMVSIFAKWARETFSFVSGEDTQVSEPALSDNLEYSSIQDILKKNNIDYDMVPTWIPDSFEVEKIEKDATPMQEIYTVLYLNGDAELRIQVRTHLSSDIQNNEIENEPIEIYSQGGIDYYIFRNLNQLRAVWVVDTYECLISGDLSIDELEMMIDSIQKGK